jgi:hypothetical protein
MPLRFERLERFERFLFSLKFLHPHPLLQTLFPRLVVLAFDRQVRFRFIFFRP